MHKKSIIGYYPNDRSRSATTVSEYMFMQLQIRNIYNIFYDNDLICNFYILFIYNYEIHQDSD